MKLEHIKLQFRRLKRHYKMALSDKDEIAFLDLAHTLRIFTDMKREIDRFAKENNFKIDLIPNKTRKNILKGSKYSYIPLATGVQGSTMIIKGIGFTNRALSEEEIQKIVKSGPPQSKVSNLTFEQWLGSGIIDLGIMDKDNAARLQLSREMLIKRVANFLGASHPQGTEEGEKNDNQFDEHIEKLHSMIVDNGFPLTYYQLIEIAQEIINGMDKFLDENN